MEGRRWIRRKNTETKTECRFQCLRGSGMGQGFQSRLGTQTHHQPSTQAQPPVFLGRIGVWGEHVPAQINGSKPFWSVPQRCMHEQAPSHHTAISKESGLLLNAREHRGSQDTISQVSTKAQNGTSIYVMKTETITMRSQILCIPAFGCQMF